MDKYEYKLKTEQMLELMESGEYRKAADLADSIDWRRVRNVTMLTNVSDIYRKIEAYDKGYDVLSIAYERAPGIRKVVSRLCSLALKLGYVDEAIGYYDEFVEIAPKDPNRYILRYQILEAKGASLDQQINALEEFKKEEYIEKWAYRLAELYREAGRIEDCLEECDDLILWFSEGEYVYKAMQLKMRYKPLTPSQQEKYSNRFARKGSDGETIPNIEYYKTKKEEEEQIPEEEALAGQFDDGSAEQPDEEPWGEAQDEEPPVRRNIGNVMRLDEALQELLHPRRVKKELEDSRKMEEPDISDLEGEIEEVEAIVDLDIVNQLIGNAGAQRMEGRKSSGDVIELVPGDEDKGSELEVDLSELEDFLDADVNSEKLPGEEKKQSEEERNLVEDILDSWESAEKPTESEEEAEPEEEATESEEETEPEEAAEPEEIAEPEEEATESEEETEPEEAAEPEEIAESEEEATESVEETELEEIAEPEEEAIESEEEAEPEEVAEPEEEIEPEEAAESEEETEPEEAAEPEEEIEPEEAAEPEEEIEPEEAAEPEEEIEPEEEAEPELILEIEDAEELELELEDAEDLEEEDKPILSPEIQRMIDEIEGVAPVEVQKPKPPKKKDDTPRENMERVTAELRFEDELEDLDEWDMDYEEELDLGGGSVSETGGILDKKLGNGEEILNDFEDADEKDFEEELFGGEPFSDEDFVGERPDLEEEFRINPENSGPDDREVPDDEETLNYLKESTPLSRMETAKMIATGRTSPIPVDEISDALSMDTGFVVHGKYDLETQSGVGTRAGLTEDQKKLFSYFVPVRGMSEQLVDVLEQDKNCTNRGGTSRTGNLLIIGSKGSGKTVLAVDVVKAIQKQRDTKQGKVAIVTGEALNKKKMTDIFTKLYGGALIIEKAGKMDERTVARLNKMMEKDTGEMLVVLEEQRKPLDRLLTSNREFRRKFTSRLEVPVFVNDELVTFGQTYAQENGYRIDEMGILALYSRIDSLQREDHAVSVAEVKEIMDEAIQRSQKASAKKFVMKMFRRNTDETDKVLLSEKDFDV